MAFQLKSVKLWISFLIQEALVTTLNYIHFSKHTTCDITGAGVVTGSQFKIDQNFKII